MAVQQRPSLGFTLVEVAIVLVIIGLIIAGVLVGRDMIESARIRSQVAAINEYNSAALAFKGKYGGIPGDLAAPMAARYGFVSGDGTNGMRDGDGLVDCYNDLQAREKCGETLCFWTDLATVRLIKDVSYFASVCSTSTTGNTTDQRFWPRARLGNDQQLVFAFAQNGRNYFQIAALTNGSSSFFTNGLASTIPPGQAYAIDSKMDDGVPDTGAVQAMNDPSFLGVSAIPAAPALGVCVANTAGNPYNTGTADYARAPACQLRFKAAF